jgi:hypothetical protein
MNRPYLLTDAVKIFKKSEENHIGSIDEKVKAAHFFIGSDCVIVSGSAAVDSQTYVRGRFNYGRIEDINLNASCGPCLMLGEDKPVIPISIIKEIANVRQMSQADPSDFYAFDFSIGNLEGFNSVRAYGANPIVAMATIVQRRANDSYTLTRRITVNELRNEVHDGPYVSGFKLTKSVISELEKDNLGEYIGANI